MGFELMQHQRIGVAHLTMNNSFALFMEQGTGKTLTTLVHVDNLIKADKIKNCLIVAPKSAMGAWERDIELFNKESQARLHKTITVINYDKVWRTRKGKQEFKKVWDCIILDEAHFIKNRTSKRSAFLLRLSLDAKYRYILTGSPYNNGNLINIWSLYAFLSPVKGPRSIYTDIFPKGEQGGSYYDFLDRYAITNKWGVPYKYVNISELQDIIQEHSYRVLKEDCMDLPDKLPDEIIEIDLIGKTKKDYKELQKESTVLELEMLAENALARMIRERQLASGHLNNNGEIVEYPTEKISILEELIDGTDKKVVVFCQFTYSIDQVAKLLKKKKLKYVTLDGRQKDKNVWRQFQEKEDIKAIIVQYESGAAGIDLFASDTIIYYEPTLKSDTLEQSRDRIHRRGQTQKCSYYHLITKGTIEESIYKALKNYSDFNQKLFTEYMSSYSKGAKIK